MFGLGTNVAIALITALIGLYFYLVRNYKFWTKKGIPGPKPLPFIGSFWQSFTKPIHEVVFDNTKKYGKIWGTYFGTHPILTIADPQLIKDINIKDFNVFVDRNDLETGDPLNDRSLFNLKSNEWKNMRSIISPTFSSGKMKKMHPIIVDCVKKLVQVLDEKASQKGKNEIQLKKMMSNLTMDVIASCAFGTKIDAYGSDRNEFVENAGKVIQAGWRLWLFFIILTTFPKVIEWTGFEQNDPRVSSFFRNAIRSMIARRKSEKKRYNDYLQLMIDAQNKKLVIDEEVIEDDKTGEIYGDPNSTDNVKPSKVKMDVTEDDVLASSFLFLVAGYETTGSLLTFLFYSLALNEKCQQRLYEEVHAFDGQYDYETISKMPYLEACVAETLRLYNPLPFTERMASEDYTLGDTGITIPKGVVVDFDIQTLHHSPEYYPNPYKWDPERFLPENRDKLVPYTYMPFGLGPRNCVGMRFALMEAKTAIAHVVNRFRFLRTENTAVPLKPLMFQFLFNCGEITVGIEKR